MTNFKKIIAVIGVITLISLYISTLYFAIYDSTQGLLYFQISIMATIFFPVILYAMSMFHRMAKNKDESIED